ncbi:MAG: hypothetical protein FWF80_07220 [Defluviitaleaceae bacterium]|nr:hypothetical protein [Defluviitaleaceae bacterium]
MKKFNLLIGIAVMLLVLAGCGVVRDAVADAIGEVLEDQAVIENGEINENEIYENDEPSDNEWHPLQETVPTPEPQLETTEPQVGGFIDIDLLGRWEFVSGTFVFYFASHSDIEFFDDGSVLEHAFGEAGTFEVLPNGQLRVEGEWDTFYFDFDISGGTLLITDRNGAAATWRRVGLRIPAGDSDLLVGRWEFVSGPAIWYFMSYGDVEFFANGRVMEYAWGEPGVFSIVGDNRMSVLGEWSPQTFYFDIEISANLLAITDHDGDRAVWRRATRAEIPEDAI